MNAKVDGLRPFRDEVRGWLEENCPADMRTPMPLDEFPEGGSTANYVNPETRLWRDRMASRGFTVPIWPKEYGGAGLDKYEVQVLREEMRRINARPALIGMGITMIGPALLEFGNEDQKAEHLPKIANGEIRWCQGYSEPNAGSDLAGLRTSAVIDGDDYIINGQKIWTSGADKADWIFCLVRTDPDASKHEGITFILFDMTSPGVTFKPIRLISGLSPFCETFFDDVRVPRKNVVTEPGKGWTVAKRLLEHERASIGSIGASGQRRISLEELALDYLGRSNGRIADPATRESVLQQRMNDRALSLTIKRAAELAESGRPPGPESSMFKYYGTEQNKSLFEVQIKILGTQGLGWESASAFTEAEINTTRAWLRSKANSIEGGTSEVQLNIIAKRVLGLPD